MKNNLVKATGVLLGTIMGAIVGYFSFAFLLALAESGNFTLMALVLPFGLVVTGALIGWVVGILIAGRKS